MFTVIYTSKEQEEKLIRKHLKQRKDGISSFFKKVLGRDIKTTEEVSGVVNSEYVYDNEDGGFQVVRLNLHTGTQCQYFMGDEGYASSISFTGFGNIRYDVNKPSEEMLKILKVEGLKAKDEFWKGASI